jgi:DNA modification methylase
MSHVLLCQGTALQLPLRDASVHCCVTSPPYYGLRSYGIGEGELGLESTPQAYIAAMVQVFQDVWRVLRPEGTLWLNMGDSYSGSWGNYHPHSPPGKHGQRLKETSRWNRPAYSDQAFLPPTATVQGLPAKNLLGMPWRLALALQAEGWILRSDIIWDKPSCMPESVQDRPTRSHEYVFLFSKQARYFYDAEAVREPTQPDPRDALWHTARSGKSMVDHAYDAERGRTETKTQAEGWVRMSNPNGRNARTVWRIPSEPFSGAHFATFPSALVRHCLLAGAPTQVCAACGAPYRRIVERTTEVATSHNGSRFDTGKSAHHGHVQHGVRYESRPGEPQLTCACAAGTQPCTVFDPFCGSGTTLLVARELGHHAVGIDLSAEYLRNIARVRLGLTALEEWQNGAAPRQDRFDDLPLFSG